MGEKDGGDPYKEEKKAFIEAYKLTRQIMEDKITSWTKLDGKKKLAKLFPDMVDRFGKKESFTPAKNKITRCRICGSFVGKNKRCPRCD